MRRIALYAMLSMSLLYSSCSREREEALLARGTEAINAGEYEKAVEALEELLDEYPEGQRRADALYALGGLYQKEQGDLERALACYRSIAQEHPDHEKAPNALFLMGFLYNNELHQLDSARTAYEEFLKRYPTNEMAASAEFELSTLGKSPDEIISQRAQALKSEKKPAKKSSP